MQLLNDLHHLTFITADMNRLISFYGRIFGARVTVDLEEEGLRHAFIEVGPHTVLHPFQVPGIEPPGELPMFGRGRLDHFALNAASEEAFREVRRRLVAEAASDGTVTDMGSLGSRARLQAAMVRVNCAPSLSTPRSMVWAMVPTVFAQPKGSSIFFRRFCETA